MENGEHWKMVFNSWLLKQSREPLWGKQENSWLPCEFTNIFMYYYPTFALFWGFLQNHLAVHLNRDETKHCIWVSYLPSTFEPWLSNTFVCQKAKGLNFPLHWFICKVFSHKESKEHSQTGWKSAPIQGWSKICSQKMTDCYRNLGLKKALLGHPHHLTSACNQEHNVSSSSSVYQWLLQLWGKVSTSLWESAPFSWGLCPECDLSELHSICTTGQGRDFCNVLQSHAFGKKSLGPQP